MALCRTALAEALQVPASEVSTATPSGWSDDHFVLALHSSGSLLAVGGRQRLIIYKASGITAAGSHQFVRQYAATVCTPAERLTALAWASFQGDADDACLLVGTSGGWLQLHLGDGTLLHRQQLHNLPVLAIRLRASGMGVNAKDEASDVTVTFADAAARVSGLEIWSIVRLQRQSWSDPERLDPLGFAKWNLKAAGPRVDGVCIGTRPPSLQALMKGSYMAAKLTIVTVGSMPPIATFEVEEHTQRGAIAMVSDIALSLKGWIPSPMRRGKEVKLQPAEPAALVAELRDDRTRVLTSLLLAPRGAMAAATDTLGRVMLLDVATLAVVCLWKGYRDAQCGWLVLTAPSRLDGAAMSDGHSTGDEADPSSPAAVRSAKRAKQDVPTEPAETQVCLVIYAPRKGVCDVYATRHGPVLHSLQCGANCRLLQTSPPLGRAGGAAAPIDCLLLDFDAGTATSVRRQLGGSS